MRRHVLLAAIWGVLFLTGSGTAATLHVGSGGGSQGFESPPGSDYQLLGENNGTATRSSVQVRGGAWSAKLDLPSGAADFAEIVLPILGKLGTASGTFWTWIVPGSAANLIPYMSFGVDANGNGVFDFTGDNSGDSFVVTFVGGGPVAQGSWVSSGMSNSTLVYVVGNRTGLAPGEFSLAGTQGAFSTLKARTFSGSTTWGDLRTLQVRVGAGEWAGAGTFVAYVDDLAYTAFFPTIQGAIDIAATADTVSVAVGTYSGNLTLNKRLTLVGAQAGTSGCGRVVAPPNPAVETVLRATSGNILQLVTGCAGSTVDGFAIDGAGVAARGINSGSGPLDSLTIRNNWIGRMTGSTISLNDPGVDVTIHQNGIAGSAAAVGGTVHLDTDPFPGLHFTSNCVRNQTSGFGLLVEGARNVGPSASRVPEIVGNVVTSNNSGMNFGTAALLGATVSGNTLSGNSFDGIQGGLKDCVVSGNTFSNNGRYGLALTSFGNLDPLRGAQNTTVTGNTFTGNAIAALFFSSAQAAGTIGTNVANQNDFTGNLLGTLYAGSETIDVSCNWWNDIGGPNAPPAHPNPLGDGLSGATLVYWPWLDGSIAGSPLCNQGNDVAAVPDGDCLSITNTCETVPVMFHRLDDSTLRGLSVTFQLSPELMLCDSMTTSIRPGTWLDAWPNRTFQLIDNGGGSYTVDQAILGDDPTPCGATAGGQLFTVDVAKGGADGIGTITVTEVIARDCLNGSLPGIPGSVGSITIDTAAPAAVVDLAAEQVRSGNAFGSDTTGVTVTFTPVPDAAVTEIWAAPFGSYPEYDDPPLGGSEPPAPASYPPPAPWILTSVTASGQDAFLENRGFWYFVAYSKDECGNVSAVSNRTDGTLNYHLGDVSDGVTRGHGDNVVEGVDVSLLGYHYGITLSDPDAYNYLDVGPTTDFSVNARPTTDNRLDFEDLMMFAINFRNVSRALPTTPGEMYLGDPHLALSTEVSGERVFARLTLEDHGRTVQGTHASVEYDASSLELVGVTQGTLLGTQDGPVFFGTIPAEGLVEVDAARLGNRMTLRGSGEVAVLEFRRLGGMALPTLGEVALRDIHNRPATRPGEDPVLTTGEPAVASSVSITEVQLVGARPNPFGDRTEVVFRIPVSSRATVRIHDVTGRLVRTLVDGTVEPGEHRAVWDGRTDEGTLAGSGIYFTTLRAGSVVQTRKLIYTR